MSGPEAQPPVSRRVALRQAGAGFFWFSFGGWAVEALRRAFPNFLYGASLAFDAGAPEAFPLGIDSRFLDEQRVWILREPRGFAAVWARCSHMAGTPRLDAGGFRCECHGSRFDGQGRVVCGPAKRPLARCAIGLGPDGRLRVDKARLCEDPEAWGRAPFFLVYDGRRSNNTAPRGA